MSLEENKILVRSYLNELFNCNVDQVHDVLEKYLTTDFKFRECITNTIGLNLIYEVKDLFKPEDAPFFSLYPVNINIAANYMMRTGTDIPQVIEDHYNYWSDRYQNFWIQTGIKLVF